jgi:hypothetical protein
MLGREMPKIILSYRRSDSDAIAGRIRDKLASHYGDASVFMDIDSIPFGFDFREHVQAALAQNDILIAIIGPKWLGPGKKNQLRINDENDPVRIEVETALKRRIPIVPILVAGANMPAPATLPVGLRELSFLNAAPLDSGRDFHQHMERLIRSMDRILQDKQDLSVALSAELKSIPSPTGASDSTDPTGSTTKPSILWHSSKRLFSSLIMQFDNQNIERDFLNYYRDRYYGFGQAVAGFCIATWMGAGTVVTLSETTELALTRFQYMVGVPILLVTFSIGFTSLAKSLWQSYFSAFSLICIGLVYIALGLMETETWFRPEQATLTYMLCLALLGLLPLRLVQTFCVGLIIVIVSVYYYYSYSSVHNEIPVFIMVMYCYGFSSALIIACCTAYLREKELREAFEAKRVHGKAAI